MSKKLCIALIVIVVLAIGGYFGIKQYERSMEQAVLEEIQKMPPEYAMTCESVSYSFFSGELVLTNARGRIELMGLALRSSYDLTRISGPNMDVFTGKAKPGMVSVADRIHVEGVRVASEDGQIDYTIKSGQVDDLRMDAHALREMYLGGAPIGAIISEALKAEFSHAEYNDMQAHINLTPGIPFSYSVERMTADNASGNRLGAASASGIAYDFEIGTAIRIAEINMKDLYMPDLGQLLEVLESGNPQRLIRSLDGNRLLAGFDMSGLSVTTEDEPFMDIARINAQSVYEPQYSHSQKIEGLVLHHEGMRAIDRFFARFVNEMGYERLEADIELAVNWTEGDKGFAVAPLRITVKDAGSITLSGQYQMPEGHTTLTGLVAGQTPVSPRLENSEVEITDNGLIERAFAAQADHMDASTETLLVEVLSEMDNLRDEARNSFGEGGAQFALNALDALEAFLLQPGTLKGAIRPRTPADAMALAFAFMLDPDSLNITVESTPGEKPLVEGFVRPDFTAPPEPDLPPMGSDDFKNLPDAPDEFDDEEDELEEGFDDEPEIAIVPDDDEPIPADGKN